MVSTKIKDKVSNSHLLDDGNGRQRRRERGAERGGTIGLQCHDAIRTLFDIWCRRCVYHMVAKMLSVCKIVLRKGGEERRCEGEEKRKRRSVQGREVL